MRVLIGHVRYRLRGGEDTVVDNEAQLLRARGHEVSELLLRNDDLDEHSLAGRIGMGVSAAWSHDGARQMTRAIEQARPDVVHLHNTFPRLSASAYVAAQRCLVPVVHTLHNFRLTCANGILYRAGGPCEACLGVLPLPAVRHGCYRDSRIATLAVIGMQGAHRLANTLGKGPSRYIALTRFAAERLVKAGIPAASLTIKPNFLPRVPDAAGAVGNYALYVGRLSPEKGVDALVEAWQRVDASLPLLVAGDGPGRAGLEQAVAAGGANIRLLGQQSPEQVAALMAQARFVVVPSLCYEGFPMVVVEALAAGRPLLVSRLGSLDELVEEGVTGYKFTPDDPVSIAECVNRAHAAPRALAQISHHARQRFDAHYSPDAAGAALESIYADVTAAA